MEAMFPNLTEQVYHYLELKLSHVKLHLVFSSNNCVYKHITYHWSIIEEHILKLRINTFEEALVFSPVDFINRNYCWKVGCNIGAKCNLFSGLEAWRCRWMNIENRKMNDRPINMSSVGSMDKDNDLGRQKNCFISNWYWKCG
jgi:hypothetical protein